MADRSVRVVLSAVVDGFVSGMKKAGDATGKLLDNVEKNSATLGKIGTTAAIGGAAVAGGIGVAVKAYADFDQAMSSVSATGEDAKANLVALREAALQAGADTKFSATEAASGVENLLKAGVSAKDALSGGLTGALALAAAGSMDVADAAEVAATAMTQFKLSGQDVPHIADLLAAGAGKAQGEVSDMAMALKQGGLVANQFGLSIEETVGGLSAFASAGLIGSDAGTSFKSMLLALANPSKEAAAQMQALGIYTYDANGKFIGLAGLAGQLKSQMSGLTDAQRQQALATIFGTDAMRAASVLYDQGTEGVSNWTKAVDQQGYAVGLASEKMGNLKGDLEQLSGSIETALIKIGSSSDAPLRGVVQNLTALVNAAADAPPELQAAALGIGAVGSAGLLAFAGVSKTVGVLADLKGALTALKISAATAGLAMGGIGVALGIAGLALGSWLDTQAKAAQLTNEFTTALQGNSDAVEANTRAVASKALQDKGAFDIARDLGLSLDTVTDAALGNAEAMAKVQAAIDAANRAQAEGAVAAGDGATFLNGEAGAANRLGEMVGATTKSLTDAEKKQRDLAAATSGAGQSLDFQSASAEATSEKLFMMNDASGKAAASSASLGVEAQRAADAIDKQRAAADEAASAALKLSGSQIGLEKAIDDATASVEQHGKTLNINTEAGRANRGALDDIAASAAAVRGAQEKASASTDAMNASTKRARDAFILTATQMGMTKQQASALADQYGLIPRTVKTAVSAPGASGATQQVKELYRAIDSLRSKTVYIQAKISASGSSQYVSPTLHSAGFATGGYIRGAGSPTSDSIPAWLSNGEFVLRAAAVKALGLDRLWYMNRYGKLPGFADGGHVHFSSATPRLAGGGLASHAGNSAAPRGPILADLEGMTLHVDIDNGRAWFGRQMAAQRRSDLIEARAL